MVIFGLIVFPVDDRARSFLSFGFGPVSKPGHWSVSRLLVCLPVIQTEIRQGKWTTKATCLHSKEPEPHEWNEIVLGVGTKGPGRECVTRITRAAVRGCYLIVSGKSPMILKPNRR